ncbi:uncharacterized protein BDZ99DRAFT_143729 [Mytilinidion resinicola]|uniref:Uncharacterized protein n=1 Tax=Mytilinidion resinicola TaxID=574789 RepID=A0A6A6Y896_9PEZI|nr:uncharacterized protein BDZ99DRAFT_143729 [Mytilinidion resinicola]KAF2804829.1 hypothetical protein BDZ99DRAFT_143729 [Mytilinidion resinicola]
MLYHMGGIVKKIFNFALSSISEFSPSSYCCIQESPKSDASYFRSVVLLERFARTFCSMVLLPPFHVFLPPQPHSLHDNEQISLRSRRNFRSRAPKQPRSPTHPLTKQTQQKLLQLALPPSLFFSSPSGIPSFHPQDLILCILYHHFFVDVGREPGPCRLCYLDPSPAMYSHLLSLLRGSVFIDT